MLTNFKVFASDWLDASTLLPNVRNVNKNIAIMRTSITSVITVHLYFGFHHRWVKETTFGAFSGFHVLLLSLNSKFIFKTLFDWHIRDDSPKNEKENIVKSTYYQYNKLSSTRRVKRMRYFEVQLVIWLRVFFVLNICQMSDLDELGELSDNDVNYQV